jgi:3-hydroxyacyl-CoA dehydrogenase
VEVTSYRIPILRSGAVLGAGTMGAQIAAHLANAGVPVLMLDVTAAAAREGLARARRLRPDPFYTAETADLVRTGSLEDDLASVREADWIIEAVIEQLDVKRNLLARVDAVRQQGSIVSSNTSGIPVSLLAEGRSGDFRRHWLGTHFFNPPRYLHLLELIPTGDTDRTVLETVARFADHRLGKGPVVAKDSPGFIANHLGVYGALRAIEALASSRYTIEEIDAITGTALGRPKSATFRTMDIAGLDILGHVTMDLRNRLPSPAAEWFRVPPLLEAMLARGWLGEKTGRGFYQRVSRAGGESEILVLDASTLTYRPRQPVHMGSLEAAPRISDVRERVRMMVASDDRVGTFLRETLLPTLVYTATVSPEIAHSIDDVDTVMRWGFGWELGPFELLDAIGVRQVLDLSGGVSGSDSPVPPLLAQVLASGRNAFRDGRPAPAAGDNLLLLRAARDHGRIVRQNAAASLVDLGNDVLCVEFHTKMNVIGGETLEMLRAGVAEAERNFAALVVGNEAPHFSAGANLLLLLLEAQNANWDGIDLMVRTFQQTTTGLRYARVPVVAAVAGLTLGGGCEVVLHADRVQAAAETYIGLVEVGVGLIPAGAGTKEMLVRTVDGIGKNGDLLAATQRAFETIGFAKTSTSAPDARYIGYLGEADAISMNRERLLFDARQRALELARVGYQAPAPATMIRVGGRSVMAALTLGVHLAWRAGRISDHDALIGRKLAGVLAGGALPGETRVPESYLLDLEREAFLSLCGEPKTLERIRYTLETGKTLRN